MKKNMNDKKQWVNRHEYPGFLKNALAIKGSVTPKVFKKVLFMIGYSSFISCLYYFIPSISLPIGPFEYAGLMMGLILVFRVNAGYDRWWEARKIWGNVVNQSRNLAIIITNYPNIKNLNWSLKVTNYIAALPYLMKNSLRGDASVEEIRHLVDTQTLSILEQSEHKPNALSSIIAQELNRARLSNELDSFSFLQAEEKRALIIDSQGACERILKTPMPFVMAVKSRRFIFSFLLALPFALVNISLMISPVITGLVAYALFSLDQIGIELQNPFSEDRLSHLPLNDICETIEKNIIEIQKITQ
ncbi:MAG: bestrophin family ion channel [bacterium]|nr:bestrophin family ion channel [bacterium]